MATEKGKSEDAEMSLDEPSGGMLTLKSSDNVAFEIKFGAACLSMLVKTSVEQDKSAKEIPIPGVKGDTLAHVVEYLRHHDGKDPGIPDKPLRSKVMKEVVAQPWDADFVDKLGEHRQQLYDVILAANYMDIKSLLHLGCAKVASLIKGVPLNKIKGILDPNQPAEALAASSSPAAEKAGGDDKKADE